MLSPELKYEPMMTWCCYDKTWITNGISCSHSESIKIYDYIRQVKSCKMDSDADSHWCLNEKIVCTSCLSDCSILSTLSYVIPSCIYHAIICLYYFLHPNTILINIYQRWFRVETEFVKYCMWRLQIVHHDIRMKF
jgi:hypothetical protein